jgi:hypothetical protein
VKSYPSLPIFLIVGNSENFERANQLGNDYQKPKIGLRSHWSSGRAPLLAPSPLRTGLEGFPFIRLEHPKTPP